MFDISTKLVSEQDEISSLETIGWENHSWKYMSLIGDERIINFQCTKVYVFSDSEVCLGKIHQNPESNTSWEERIGWITTSQEPTKFEWNIFPGLDYVAALRQSQKFTEQIRRNTRNFTGRILFMSMFNDISCGTKDNEKECLAHAKVVSLYARKFGTRQWSFIGAGSEKKWYSMKEDSPQGIWDKLAEKMLLEFAESGCPIFRATTPLSRGQLKSKGHGKLSIHFAAYELTIETIFALSLLSISSVSTEQWQLYVKNLRAIKNRFTLKQMFDISTRLVFEQEEISGLETIGWENHSWKCMSLIGDERIINLQRTKVYVFSDSVLCHGKTFENPESNEAWEQRSGWIKSSQNHRNFDRIDGEPMEFEWNIFPGFTTLQLCGKVTGLLSSLGEEPETFTGRILFMSMFNDISCGTKDNEEESLAYAKLVSLYARRFGGGQWTFIGSGSERKWCSINEDSRQRIWDKIAEKMWEFTECGCPIFRATTPLSRGQLKNKRHGKLSTHYAADKETIETIFGIMFLQISSVFTEQSRKCVKNMKPFTTDRGDLM